MRLPLFRSLLVALVLGFAPLTAHADNSAQAHRVLTCTYSYHGEPGSYELADLTGVATASDRASMERMVQRWALVETAGTYNHEYAQYPGYPQSVKPADLDGWRCVWSKER